VVDACVCFLHTFFFFHSLTYSRDHRLCLLCIHTADAVVRSDVELQVMLVTNMILTGGGSCIDGLSERLKFEGSFIPNVFCLLFVHYPYFRKGSYAYINTVNLTLSLLLLSSYIHSHIHSHTHSHNHTHLTPHPQHLTPHNPPHHGLHSGAAAVCGRRVSGPSHPPAGRGQHRARAHHLAGRLHCR
jgi:hypothetical protein